MGYLDDIIIYSRLEKEHLEHLEEIFTRLRAAGLKLKLEKCCFFKNHIQYLGHLISAEGIQPLPEKLESIAKMPAPKNPKEVKQFLGLVGYYRKFVPRFADISRILIHLTKKDIKFKCIPECENCFQILKEFLQQTPILKYPDPQASYTLYTEASKYAYTGICLGVCVCIHRHINPKQQWYRPSHHLHQRIIPWITIKLGNTHQGSLCNLHVSEKTQLLHRHCQNNSEK